MYMSASAQFSISDYEELNHTHYLSFEGQSLFFSNSVSTKTLRSFYGNNYIDNATKESVNYRKQIYGISDISGGLQYIWVPDTQKCKIGVYVNAGTRHIRAGNLAPAFYELAMFGNSRFAGEYANLSNSRFLFIDYQKLSLGISARLSSDSSRSFAAFHISPVKGQRYMEGETAKMSFYTSELGELLSLQAEAVYFSSDQSHRRNQDFAGTGFAAGAMLYIHNPERKFWIYTSVSDIGSIKWKHKSYRTYIDTSMYFSGIFIDNVFSFDTSLLHLSSDTLNKLLQTFTDTFAFKRSLPETFYLEGGKYFPSHKITVSGSMQYTSRTGMPWPRIQAGVSYSINNYFKPYISVSHGGLGRFSCGAGISSCPFPRISIHICTPDLLAFMLPAYSYANGVWLKMSYKM
jgi:hypothetical protein